MVEVIVEVMVVEVIVEVAGEVVVEVAVEKEATLHKAAVREVVVKTEPDNTMVMEPQVLTTEVHHLVDIEAEELLQQIVAAREVRENLTIQKKCLLAIKRMYCKNTTSV